MLKIALITGANKGIGLETARQLGEAGLRVVIAARDERAGQAAAESLRADGLDATSVQLDVSDDDSIARAVQQVGSTTDHLDVLVNNAGVYASGTPSGTTREMLRTLFETNVFGVVAVTNAFLPLLRRAGSARIVNVSSEVASLAVVTDPSSPMSGMQDLAYQSSKGAVNWVTILFAKELADAGIKVNAAIPGYVSTDLNQHTGYIPASAGAAPSVSLALLPDDGPTITAWGHLTSTPGDDMSVAPW